jgi:hypothetical protein
LAPVWRRMREGLSEARGRAESKLRRSAAAGEGRG